MGQPFAQATEMAAMEQEPTLDSVMQTSGPGPGMRDQFMPPDFITQATAGPLPSIQELQATSQPPAQTSILQMDFQDPTNLFAPTSGPVAERFRMLQQQYAQDLADEPPLTPLQILGLTMASIANPKAVQDTLKARRQRTAQRARDRRAMNAKLMDVAANSVALESDLRLKQYGLQMDKLKLDHSMETERRQRALSDSEIAVNEAQREKLDLENQRMQAFGGREFSPAGAFPGFRPSGLNVDPISGRVTESYDPETPALKLYTDALSRVSEKDQFGIFPRPTPEVQATAIREALSDPNLTVKQRNDLQSLGQNLQTSMGSPVVGPTGSAGPGPGPTLGEAGSIPESLRRAYPDATIEPLF